MTKMIRAVIFDMDGLMFDTEKPYIQLFEKLSREHGINFPKECLEQLIGVSSHVVSKFEKDYPGITEIMDEVDEKYDDYFFSIYPHPGDANKEGLSLLFDYLNKNGYKKAIASSSRKRHILNLVRYSRVEMNLDAVVSSHSDIPSKPAPDVFLEAARQIGVKPDECLVLEDSKFGIMAAYNAKMHRVWIPDLLTNSKDFEEYLEYRCDNLAEVINILEQNKLENNNFKSCK